MSGFSVAITSEKQGGVFSPTSVVFATRREAELHAERLRKQYGFEVKVEERPDAKPNATYLRKVRWIHELRELL